MDELIKSSAETIQQLEQYKNPAAWFKKNNEIPGTLA